MHIVLASMLIAAVLFTAAGSPVSAISSPRPTIAIAVVAGPEINGLKAVAPLWEKETGIHVDLIEFPFATLYQKEVSALQTRETSFDMLMINNPWLPKLASTRELAELDSALGYRRSQSIPKILYEMGMWPPPMGPVPPGAAGTSRLYAVSFVGNVQFFAYRKDLIPTPPRTWNDVLANARRLTNPSKDLYGFVIRGKKPFALTDFMSVLASFGGSLVNDKWQPAIDSPAARQAANLFMELKKLSPPGTEAYDAADRARDLATGRAAQGLTWPAEVTGFIENPQISKVNGKMAYEAPPRGTGASAPLLGNWMLGIPEFSQHKETALRFVEWLTSERIQATYTRAGGVPVNRIAMLDPGLNKRFPYLKAMAGSLDSPGATWWPRTPEFFAIMQMVGTHISAMVSGLESVDQALQTSADEIRSHLREVGYYK